jgi:hypothetical protein
VDQATVAGTVNLTSSHATGTVVQFLLDGQAFGAPVPPSSYGLAWDTTTVLKLLEQKIVEVEHQIDACVGPF